MPGDPKQPVKSELPSVLHVDMRPSDQFILSWRRGDTVVSEERVPRTEVRHAEAQVRYPALADAVAKAWSTGGLHRAASDPERDRAVVHSGNAATFDDIVGTMDAIRSVRRVSNGAVRHRDPSAFDVIFAVD